MPTMTKKGPPACAASTDGMNALNAIPNVTDVTVVRPTRKKKIMNRSPSGLRWAIQYTRQENTNGGRMICGNSTRNFAKKYETASYACAARSL